MIEQSSSRKKTKSVYVSTVISIALVLLMTGLLGLILVHAKNLSKYVKENIVLNVIVNDNVSEGDILSLQKDIEKDPYVLNSEYISKELAAKNLKEDLGENFLEYLVNNQLFLLLLVYFHMQLVNTYSFYLYFMSYIK